MKVKTLEIISHQIPNKKFVRNNCEILIGQSPAYFVNILLKKGVKGLISRINNPEVSFDVTNNNKVKFDILLSGFIYWRDANELFGTEFKVGYFPISVWIILQ